MAKRKVGRPKGSIDIISRRARTAIANIIDTDFTDKDIRRLLADIERENGPKQAFDCYMVMMDYILPKLQRIEHTGKDGEGLSIEHVLNTLQPPAHPERLPVPDNSDIIDAEPIKDHEKELSHGE